MADTSSFGRSCSFSGFRTKRDSLVSVNVVRVMLMLSYRRLSRIEDLYNVGSGYPTELFARRDLKIEMSTSEDEVLSHHKLKY
jgi:hypothetical protein